MVNQNHFVTPAPVLEKFWFPQEGCGVGLSFRVELPDLVTSANFGLSRVGFLGSFRVEIRAVQSAP